MDSSALIRNEIRRFLQSRGYVVKTAENGLEAIGQLEEFTPHLIVTALILPKISGSELIREARHRPATADVTIVAVSGRRGRDTSGPKSDASHTIFKEVDLVEQLRLVLDSLSVRGGIVADSRPRKKGLSAG